MWSISDPKVDDGRRHHDADALQQVPNNMDEGGADARVAVATEERVGMAVGHGTLTVLVNVVVAAAVSMEGGWMMEDVGHAAEKMEGLYCRAAMIRGMINWLVDLQKINCKLF